MPSRSGLHRAISLARIGLSLAVEAGKMAAVYSTQREASSKAFRHTLTGEQLPAQVVEELSAAYRAGQIRLREIVRARGLG